MLAAITSVVHAVGTPCSHNALWLLRLQRDRMQSNWFRPKKANEIPRDRFIKWNNEPILRMLNSLSATVPGTLCLSTEPFLHYPTYLWSHEPFNPQRKLSILGHSLMGKLGRKPIVLRNQLPLRALFERYASVLGEKTWVAKSRYGNMELGPS